jgi:hypothetical protein
MGDACSSCSSSILSSFEDEGRGRFARPTAEFHAHPKRSRPRGRPRTPFTSSSSSWSSSSSIGSWWIWEGFRRDGRRLQLLLIPILPFFEEEGRGQERADSLWIVTEVACLASTRACAASLSSPLLVEFERETIGIGKEGESFPGELIDAHLFDSNSLCSKGVHRMVEIVHGEGEMT